MTIESQNVPKVKKPGKLETAASDKSPLLPKRRQVDDGEVHEGFNGASFSGAVFNLSTTVVGAGIMALPATMKVLGLVLGFAMIIFVCILTDACIEILLRFSRVGKSNSYGVVMGDAFGRAGKIALQICVIVNNLGVLIVYMIIIDYCEALEPRRSREILVEIIAFWVVP